MTSKQAISAAGQLATKGIITGDQFATVLPVLTQLQNQYDSSIGSQTAGTLLNQQA
jgi:hypothetical protein